MNQQDSSDEIIYNELVQSDYAIKTIRVCAKFTHIEIEIEFEETKQAVDFVVKIYNKYFIHYNISDATLSLNININIQNNNWIDKFEHIGWPTNTKEIIILIGTNVMNVNNCMRCIKLSNIPNKIIQLEISSCMLFELNNLPTSLICLDLSKSTRIFNLDYLPSSLQILKLPPHNIQTTYKYSHVQNLPSTLIDIYHGSAHYNNLSSFLNSYSIYCHNNKN